MFAPAPPPPPGGGSGGTAGVPAPRPHTARTGPGGGRGATADTIRRRDSLGASPWRLHGFRTLTGRPAGNVASPQRVVLNECLAGAAETAAAPVPPPPHSSQSARPHHHQRRQQQQQAANYVKGRGARRRSTLQRVGFVGSSGGGGGGGGGDRCALGAVSHPAYLSAVEHPGVAPFTAFDRSQKDRVLRVAPSERRRMSYATDLALVLRRQIADEVLRHAPVPSSARQLPLVRRDKGEMAGGGAVSLSEVAGALQGAAAPATSHAALVPASCCLTRCVTPVPPAPPSLSYAKLHLLCSFATPSGPSQRRQEASIIAALS